MTDRLDRSVLRGWEVLTLRSEALSVGVVPGLGGTLVGLTRAGDDTPVSYATPWGLPGAGTGLLGGSAEELRADADPGGWQTLFPNAGDNAVVDGIEWGVDGEARVTPLEVTGTRAENGAGENRTNEDGTGEDTDPVSVTMTGRLRRSPFRLTKTIALAGDTVTVTEEVENQGRQRSDVLWGSRICLGAPLVAEGTELDCGASLVHPDAAEVYDADYADVFPWPRVLGRTGMVNLRYLPEPGLGGDRTAYLTAFSDGWAEVRNETLRLAVRVEWDAETWPHLWYRLEDGAERGHPWFGREHFLTLSPCSGWPARGLHDARRISGSSLALDPGESLTTTHRVRVRTLDAH
ncbi:hypothetical protein FHX74_003523 [Friedmanniella endophytica]|uniref:Galactose mutarotase n=1 Tax=Microlunatus kandeliicorticis TaxID=1759536 RepID=A0A7W3P7E4_9ACTN|nr:hypothetical protein [Microlunatus kandeliicorticis]MBA8795882.1 hypothetical protein [Microlunatus kandeliicorticis]